MFKHGCCYPLALKEEKLFSFYDLTLFLTRGFILVALIR